MLTLALTFAVGAVVAWGTAAASAATSPCSRAPSSGGHTITLSSGGRRRVALLHVPRGIPTGHHVPIVLVLHGTGRNGRSMERYSGFSRTADRYGFVAAYPSAAGPVWNFRASRTAVDDVAFLSALVSRVEQTVCVDQRRIFAAGVSNGGGMAALLGCRLSALRAIAAVEGDYSRQPTCRPKHPLSLLEIHGTADRVAPYYGPGGHPSSNGLPPFVNAWVRIDRCSRRAATNSLATRTTLFRFGGCRNAVTVEHVRIRGGEHQWPGATPPDPGLPATVCATCTIWRFFSHGRL